MSAVRAGKDKNSVCERRLVVYRAKKGKGAQNDQENTMDGQKKQNGGKLRGLAQINHLKALAERQQRRLVNPKKFGRCGAFAADPGHTDEFCRFGSLESQGLDQMKWKIVFGVAKPFRPKTLQIDWPSPAALARCQIQFLGRESAILSPAALEVLVRAALPARLLSAKAYVQFKASTDGFLMGTLVASFQGSVIRQALGEDARVKYNADINFGSLVLSRTTLFIVKLRGCGPADKCESPAAGAESAQKVENGTDSEQKPQNTSDKVGETTLCVTFDMDGLSGG